jgi:hypothetical protein
MQQSQPQSALRVDPGTFTRRWLLARMCEPACCFRTWPHTSYMESKNVAMPQHARMQVCFSSCIVHAWMQALCLSCTQPVQHNSLLLQRSAHLLYVLCPNLAPANQQAWCVRHYNAAAIQFSRLEHPTCEERPACHVSGHPSLVFWARAPCRVR